MLMVTFAHVWSLVEAGTWTTFMGISVGDFPNIFFTYGPQAPTALCNGPSCAEIQGEWIVELLKHMRQNQLGTVNATSASEAAWADHIGKIANMSLLPTAKSWYTGDYIPGKTREPLIYLGGVPSYHKTLSDCAAKGYEGFELNYRASNIVWTWSGVLAFNPCKKFAADPGCSYEESKA